MNVILTSMCCGKTFLEKHDTKYVDLDIFANVKTQRQIRIVRQMIADFAEKCDKENIYLFNMDRFFKYELETISSIKILEVIIPSKQAFSYYEMIYQKREIKENGVVRTNAFNCFCKSLRLNLEKAKELEKQGLKVTYLESNCGLLKDYLLSKET